MSAAGPKLVQDNFHHHSLNGRTPLGHLLHALNQPLTGLQCSMELATVGIRSIDHYIRSLHDWLGLVSRIQLLAGAVREIVDLQELITQASTTVSLDKVLEEVVRDLQPLALSPNIRIDLQTSTKLDVSGSPNVLQGIVFRWLESALASSRENASIEIIAAEVQKHASIAVSWTADNPPDSSALSPSALGLLIVQAGWERMGGYWSHQKSGVRNTCAVKIPLANPSPTKHPSKGDQG